MKVLNVLSPRNMDKITSKDEGNVGFSMASLMFLFCHFSKNPKIPLGKQTT